MKIAIIWLVLKFFPCMDMENKIVTQMLYNRDNKIRLNNLVNKSSHMLPHLDHIARKLDDAAISK